MPGAACIELARAIRGSIPAVGLSTDIGWTVALAAASPGAA
jgi:hypothetical protein